MPISDEIIERKMLRLQSTHSESGVSDQIIDRKIQQDYEPTGATSAITGKPVERFTGKGGSGGSYVAHVAQGYVDDPIIKAKIYASHRFPNMDEADRLARYDIVDDNIVYQADNGKWYREDAEMFPYKAKRFLGELTTNLPAAVGGAVGEFTSGAPGAFLGAAAGEAVRKGVGHFAYGEELTTPRYLKDVTSEGLLGMVGSVPGRGVIRVGRKIGAIPGGMKAVRTARAAGPELPKINFKAAIKLQKQAKQEFGIDLFDAQTTESRRLLSKLRLYGELPTTSEMFQVAKKIQDEQAFNAVDDFMTALYDPEPEYITAAAIKMRDGRIKFDIDRPRMHYGAYDKLSMAERANILDDQGFVTSRGRWLTRREASDVVGAPTEDANEIVGRVIPGTDQAVVGVRLSEAAEKSIQREIDARMRKAQPYYKKAFKSDTRVDIQPHIDELDEMIKVTPETSPRRNALKKYKRMLHRTVKVEDKDYLIPESRIEYLDEIKKSTDEFIDSFSKDAPIPKRTKRDIRTVKNKILKTIDDVNDDYKKARQLWADDSDAIKRLTHKTKLQQVADLEGDQVENASRLLLSHIKNSPGLVKRARARIIREDPEAWNAALRTHLEDIFYQTKRSAEGGAEDSAKMFNAFYRNTIGLKKQKKILRAALGDAFPKFERMVDILRRVGLVVRKGSDTMPKSAMMEEDKTGGGFVLRQIAARFKPLVTHRRLAWEKLMELQTDRGMKLMAETLLDPRASQHLLKIHKMGVNTEAGIRATSTFFSLVLGGEFKRHGPELYKSYKEYKQMNKLQPSH